MIIDQDSISGELRYYAHTLSPDFERVWIIPTSDAHFGDPLFSEKHFKRHVKFIADNPHIFTVLNGDLCDCAIRDSVGDVYKQILTPQDQRDYMIDILMPIKDKVLGVTMGNHERRIYKDVGLDICKDIATALNAPYRPEGLLLKLSFGKGNKGMDSKPYVYYQYQTHGYGGARTKGAKAVKVQRLSAFLTADVFIMSHDHDVHVDPDILLDPDDRTKDSPDGFRWGKVVARRILHVKSGAFLKWGGYGESGGFAPVDLSNPVIKYLSKGDEQSGGKPIIRVEV